MEDIEDRRMLSTVFEDGHWVEVEAVVDYGQLQDKNRLRIVGRKVRHSHGIDGRLVQSTVKILLERFGDEVRETLGLETKHRLN